MSIKNLVTGGAGFVGSHLIDKLIEKEEEVICIDNFFTGRKSNIHHLIGNPKFELIRHDITEPIRLETDRIWHLACPASPAHYQLNPITTAKTSFIGTQNMLGLAKRTNSRILLASTSEIYGNPLIHPQPETYFGNVNNIGIRSCYDEGKRIAETLCFDYYRVHKVDIRIIRIFNTYGPRMQINDGRVISNFIVQALKNRPLTVYGDGSQTRSFCFVSDLVDGMMRCMNSDEIGPINIGNPNEFTILELAELIKRKLNNKVDISFKDLPQDDPMQRKPSIDLAYSKLKWKPNISLEKGLIPTIDYFRNLINEEKEK
tara:strand:- start:4021 stop:4968 length:948 start_codon:yes stop_codon:yes gene_type:complete